MAAVRCNDTISAYATRRAYFVKPLLMRETKYRNKLVYISPFFSYRNIDHLLMYCRQTRSQKCMGGSLDEKEKNFIVVLKLDDQSITALTKYFNEC